MRASILNKLLFTASIVSIVGFSACNDSSQSDTPANGDSAEHTNTGGGSGDANTGGEAEATLSGTKPDTTVSGTVKFTQNGNKVKMNLDISVPNKANQSVAVHFHDHGDCGHMGKDAMGHWNPTHKDHGKWGTGSFHSGDIGNINLDASGKGSMELETDLWSIGGDSTTNIIGKSLIVHSGVDDYTSQPSGNSGERIGCGVIQKTGQ